MKSKSSRDSPKSTINKKLSPSTRFLLYGLIGITLDVAYFALVDTLNEGRLFLVGRTNLFILIVYGTIFLLLESIIPYMKHRRVSIYIRCLVYILVGYTFELATGYFLWMIGQDYWDYSDYSYNLKGIIMPHTSPLIVLLGLVAENFIIDGVTRLTLASK